MQVPVIAVAGILAAIGLAPPAAATDQYLYWSYWNANGSQWQYKQEGPASNPAPDGSVQGWHYGPGSAPPGRPKAPAPVPDFNAACYSTAPQPGQKRVAVVIDSGSGYSAPPGQTAPGPLVRCAQIPTGANGLQALSDVASVRQSGDGMVCGINGYPSSGCSQVVGAGSPMPGAGGTQVPATAATATSWGPFVAGAALIVLLIIGGAVVARRRAR